MDMCKERMCKLRVSTPAGLHLSCLTVSHPCAEKGNMSRYNETPNRDAYLLHHLSNVQLLRKAL
jgi:hypothetical protein